MQDWFAQFAWVTEPAKGTLWIYQVFVLILLTLFASFLARYLLHRLLLQLRKTKMIWDDALVEALQKPIRYLIWLLGISFSIQFAKVFAPAEIFDLVEPLRRVGVVALISWFLVRFIGNYEQELIRKEASEHKLDHTTVNAVAKLFKAAVLITTSLVALQSLGYSISGVLAFGGIGGIAVGFAAKDLLANFFGGVMIYLDRPFSVGDWIRSPDRNIEGTVTKIGWRLTQITTFDKRPLYVPNAVFTNITVENPSRMTFRRIYETIGIRYADADKLPSIVSEVKNMLIGHSAIASEQTIIVNFNTFAPSSLDFFIYTFTKTTDWVEFHEVKQQILIQVMDIIAAAGAEIAFPTSTLHLNAEAPLPLAPLASVAEVNQCSRGN